MKPKSLQHVVLKGKQLTLNQTSLTVEELKY